MNVTNWTFAVASDQCLLLEGVELSNGMVKVCTDICEGPYVTMFETHALLTDDCMHMWSRDQNRLQNKQIIQP
jgi:hypothetical protein